MPANRKTRNASPKDAMITIFAANVRKYCGYGKVLLVEPDGGGLGTRLTMMGIKVVSAKIDYDNDTFVLIGNGVTGRAIRDEAEFDTVIVHAADQDVSTWRQNLLTTFCGIVRKFAILIINSCDDHGSDQLAGRAVWESIFYENGFRKHAGYYGFNDYSSLQMDRFPLVIPLERISPFAVKAFPLSVLLEERSLHMDMMREPGSRSDAHIVRYTLAAAYIRPGDRVIDAACGMGYGAHVLSQLSQATSVTGYDLSDFSIRYAATNYGSDINHFICGSLPDCLYSIADNSCDVVVSFETLEHVADAKPLLQEFERILTPGGRIVASVPNDWTDESGGDPNPYHLQVYTLDKFISELSEFFHLEKLLGQTADRVKKPAGKPGEFVNRPRSLENIAFGSNDSTLEAEWLLAIGCKDLRLGESIPFADPMFSESERRAAGAALAIAEHYDNPWIFRSLLSIGMRIENATLRQMMAAQRLNSARLGSADEGACLCILAYIELEAMFEEFPEELRRKIIAYINIATPENPTITRWKISLSFALALVALKENDHQTAEKCFLDVIKFNPADYHITLLTKSADAGLRLGYMYAAAKEPENAKRIWKDTYFYTRRSLNSYLGENSSDVAPVFELNEISEIFARLTQISGALRTVDQANARPFFLATETSRDIISQLNQSKEYILLLEEAKGWLMDDIKASAHIMDDKDAWTRDLIEARDWWQLQWQSAKKHADDVQAIVSEQKEWIQSLTEAKEWLEMQWRNATSQSETSE